MAKEKSTVRLQGNHPHPVSCKIEIPLQLLSSAFMFSSVSEEDPGSFITELIRFSNQAALLKTERYRSHEQNQAALQTLEGLESFSYINNGATEVVSAAPLMPLNDRDLKVLETFFQGDGIHEMAIDIARCLRQLQPEPCWDDDPMEMEFLKEYL